MRYNKIFLAGTLILIHLVMLLFVPYLHVHPQEDHSHIQGRIGHVHISAILEDTGPSDDAPHNESIFLLSSHKVLHSELPGHLLLTGTVWFYTTVSHFRWHTPIYFVVATFFPDVFCLPAVTSAYFTFPSIDIVSSLLVSHAIFHTTDLPPPVA